MMGQHKHYTKLISPQSTVHSPFCSVLVPFPRSRRRCSPVSTDILAAWGAGGVAFQPKSIPNSADPRPFVSTLFPRVLEASKEVHLLSVSVHRDRPRWDGHRETG